jgi:hypothetical protein
MSETPTSAPLNGAELLARIKPRFREESTQICLRPDLLDEWGEADEALKASKAKDMVSGRLAGGVSAETKKLAKRVQELEEQIEQVAITCRFRAMSKDRWQALIDNHPPRAGDQMDLFAGYNRDAVLDAAVRVCLIDPVFADCTQEECDHTECGTWQQFAASCNPSEWKELKDTVNSVNRGVVDLPKSVLASQILSSPGSGSRRRARGA